MNGVSGALLVLPALLSLVAAAGLWLVWLLARLRRRRPERVRRAALVATLVGLSAPLQPTVTWGIETVACGHQPVEATDFAAADSYHVPGSPFYDHWPVFDSLYCSAAAAERAGYHRS